MRNQSVAEPQGGDSHLAPGEVLSAASLLNAVLIHVPEASMIPPWEQEAEEPEQYVLYNSDI